MKKWGWAWFWREQTSLTSCRGIFADEKAAQWKDFSVVLMGRRVVKGKEMGVNLKEGRLSSLIEPRSMVCTELQTHVQFIAQTNQSKVLSAWRFEVSKVEAL